MKNITIYTTDHREDKYNTVYPIKYEVNSVKSLQNAVRNDHVCAEYIDGRRSIKNFIRSDCLPFDCDNDHSNMECEWKTALDVEKAFPGVPFYVVYSRHHMKWKGKFSPRPRFHVIFPIDPINNGDDYRALKESVIAFFPYFDTGAKDAARFFFGVKDPEVELHGGDDDEP